MLMNVNKIQPSQLYINFEKLSEVMKWFNPEDVDSYEPIPVKMLNNTIIFTDGHTRGLAAYLKGIEKISVYWDEDEMDWEAYQICVDWCKNQKIFSIKELETRIISQEEYQILWLNRCRDMHDKLEIKRREK